MDSSFIYNSPVSGKHFTGRKSDTLILGNLLNASENVAIYDIPRSGISSLIRQAVLELKTRGLELTLINVSILSARSKEEFSRRIGEGVIKAFANTPDEYKYIIDKMLPGTHFVFDKIAFSEKGTILSTNWDLDDNDISSILSLPFRIASEKDEKLCLVIDNFQCISLLEDSYRICKLLEGVFSEYQSAPCSYVMTGSQYNAMKDIFDVQRFFYRQVEIFNMQQIDERDIIDFAVKGFQTTGKVVERELIMGLCRLLKCHIGYISQMLAICDSLSKGYINENILNEALNSILAINEPHFIAIMNDLTTFQTRLLRAIVDGNTKFSSSEIIEQYGLNSSANVKRLKDALTKKEIACFDANDNATILDPLFDYWVTKYFFEK